MYQIEQVRRITGAQGVVCVMSGSFVQRGEPGIFDKYARAEAAVRCGADLVLELPMTAAIDSAEGFARGGVRVMNDLGCIDYLTFGSESGELSTLEKTVDILVCPEFQALMKDELAKGSSYATARENAAVKLEPGIAGVLAQPNDILAVEYLKALRFFGSSIEPVAIKRTGVGHHEKVCCDFASATEIRRRIRENEPWSEFVPESAAKLFAKEMEAGRGPYSLKNAERAVLYRLKTMTNEEFDRLPFNAEGLSVRLQRYARSLGSTEQILDEVKTKRYAHARLRRMVLCAYLGLFRDDLEQWPGYIRVLAFNDCGREIMRNCAIPILNNSGQIREMPESDRRYFDMESRCEDLLALCLPGNTMPEYGRAWRERARIVKECCE